MYITSYHCPLLQDATSKQNHLYKIGWPMAKHGFGITAGLLFLFSFSSLCSFHTEMELVLNV